MVRSLSSRAMSDAGGGPSETSIFASTNDRTLRSFARELATLLEPKPEVNGEAVYHIFLVTRWTGVGPLPKGEEHSEIRWFPIEDAVKLDLAHPAYVELLKQL
jgi:8-oxo-dGTP pyrophosphatase MutT (NUDIX family)